MKYERGSQGISKLGHPRSIVKNTSPWEIAVPGSSDCIAISIE